MPLDGTSGPLSEASLERLDPAVAVARYDRRRLAPSIVHVGVGGFHRAHLATYVHELCANGHRDWSIVGAGVLPGDRAMADALSAQDHLYALITRGPTETSVDVVGSIVDYVFAADAPNRLAERVADPRTQVVSLTVTEGGYPVDDGTGEFVPAPPPHGGASTFAALAAGLEQRRRLDHAGLTVLSCDNVVGNGEVARTATLGEAALIGDALVRWIDDAVSFPNSMVDRITPATSDADRTWLADTHGLVDRWPVVTEPFRQWVVEDRFAGARPPLEELDVIVTDDVAPYELMKLRLLNAGHSCLAYLAARLEHRTVDDALADPAVRAFLEGFYEREAKPAMPPVTGVDLDDYTDTVIERFSNPRIKDQIARLCLDGTAKFPKFLLPTIRSRLATGDSVALGALALAGWCEYLNGTTEGGVQIELAADPQRELAIEHALASQRDPAAFLAMESVFGTDLPAAEPFVSAFCSSLGSLRTIGIRSTIDATLREVGPADDRSSR